MAKAPLWLEIIIRKKSRFGNVLAVKTVDKELLSLLN
jgi:hypothetical protein